MQTCLSDSSRRLQAQLDRAELMRWCSSPVTVTSTFSAMDSANSLSRRERIAHFAVIGLGPEMLVGCAANQLGRDANAIAFFHDRAFDDSVHAECSGDLRYGELRIL